MTLNIELVVQLELTFECRRLNLKWTWDRGPEGTEDDSLEEVSNETRMDKQMSGLEWRGMTSSHFPFINSDNLRIVGK